MVEPLVKGVTGLLQQVEILIQCPLLCRTLNLFSALMQGTTIVLLHTVEHTEYRYCICNSDFKSNFKSGKTNRENKAKRNR